MSSEEIIFYILSSIILVSAVLVIRLQNVFKAALSLIVALLGVAGLFLLLRAEFLALVQVLIYSGAIAVLILFAVMLTPNLMNKKTKTFNHQQLISFLISGVFLVVVGFIIYNTFQFGLGKATNYYNLNQIAELLLTKYLWCFELVSVVLLVALIGAIFLAKPKT